jgi:hypothetical protein
VLDVVLLSSAKTLEVAKIAADVNPLGTEMEPLNFTAFVVVTANPVD